jgi:peptide/nickel transport system substrate-binding protein
MRIAIQWLVLFIMSVVTLSCGGPQSSPPTTPSPTVPTPSTAPEPLEAVPSVLIAPTTETKVIADLVGEKGEGTPADGDWLVSRLPVEPSTLNPVLDTADAYTQRICMRNVFETLLEFDNRSLQPKPALAEKWDISGDHLKYTFYLKKGVTFSDGTPLTAHDVKFTFDAIQDPKNETKDIANYFQDITSTEATDDHTIVFSCSKPYFRHLVMIGDVPIFPKHLYSQGNFNTHEFNRKPVGSGPYLFDTWETNNQIALRRNPNYWNQEGRPHLDKIVWRVITDDDSALEVFMRGDIDSIGLSPEQWHSRAEQPEFRARANTFTTLSRPGYIGGYSYIAWNMRRPLFEDKRVRHALTMLLDRETILREVFYGLGIVVSGPEFSGSPEYDASVKPIPFDPNAAQALLTEAGWKDSDNDGILDKNGVKFEFGYIIPSGNHEYEVLATVYQEQLKKAGIQMTVLQREWGSLIESLTKRAFDAITLQWAIPIDSEPYQVWHSSQADAGSNYPGFKNAEADKLMEDIRLEFDRSKRIPMFHKFHQIVADEQPYTFIFNIYTLGALDKRFRNVYVYAQGTDPREWWVPSELQKYRPGESAAAPAAQPKPGA